MKKENWIWMPHPGHLIIAHECRFVLNTYVGGYIVSTVGEWVPAPSSMKFRRPDLANLKGDDLERKFISKYGYEEIGAGRKYETMVFKAKKEIAACCPYVQTGSELECYGYNSADLAYKGHMKACNIWADK